MRSQAFWFAKAGAIAPALPGASNATICAALSVAVLETNAGEAWHGAHNWGATTKRGLSSAEAATLAAAHVVPVLEPTAARLSSEEAATARLGVKDDVEIHVDSYRRADQTLHVYFTYFAKFATDEEGAAYFVTFFRTAAEKAALAAGSVSALAAAMYQAGYYKGGSTDAATNIAAYTRGLTPIFAEALAALSAWTTGATAAEEPALGWTWTQVQAALNAAAPVKGRTLTVDGVPGPLTRADLTAYQETYDLPVTGCADVDTITHLSSVDA